MMRKIILILFVCLMAFEMVAQNRSIRFLNEPWDVILKKSKKTDKLIFLDCYTSWCGPCQTLAKEVFTLDSVADFFNRNFICVKYDMEKEGKQLKDVLEISAFPTLLYLDGKQHIVHRQVGYGGVESFMGEAKKALSPDRNFSSMRKRYESGCRDNDFILDYLTCLGNAYLKEEADAVAVEYLEQFDEAGMVSEGIWKVIDGHVTDPLSMPLRTVMKHREEFFKFATEEQVMGKLNLALRSTVHPFTEWRPDRNRIFNHELYAALVSYLKTLEVDVASECLAQLYTAKYMFQGDFRRMLDEMYRVVDYRIMPRYMLTGYLVNFLSALRCCDEDALVREGIVWVENLKKEWEGYDLSSILHVHSVLEKRLGNAEKAEKLQDLARKTKDDETARIMEEYKKLGIN